MSGRVVVDDRSNGRVGRSQLSTTELEAIETLSERGYVVMADVFDPAQCRSPLQEAIEAAPKGRSDFEGFATRRAFAILAKTTAVDALVCHPVAMAACDRFLRNYWLSACVAIDIGPGESRQPPHFDDSVYGLPAQFDDVLISTMWAIDDFTAENGATVLYPEVGPRGHSARMSGVPAVMRAGSVLIYKGSLVHGGGANISASPRLGLAVQYVQSWLRQHEQQVLVVPPAEASMRSRRLAELIGYQLHPPFLGVVDGRHPRELLDAS